MTLPLFDSILPAITISSNQELSLNLGGKTLVYLTAASSFTIFGIATTGGNVDGAVVTLVNVSNSASVQFTFAHESSSASALVNRFRNSSQTSIASGFGIGGVTYLYVGSLSRWVVMSHT